MLAHFIFLSLLHCISSYIVVPDDCYSNATCHHCRSLHYYLQNSSKYITHNTQLLFLPGVYCLHNDLVIENVYNISLIGRSNEYSNTSTIIQCNSSVGIVMKNITNLSVENMVIKNCWASSFSAAVTIKECSSVKLNHIQIYHIHYSSKDGMCLKGFNVMGDSYLDHISCDKQMRFDYYETNTSLNNQMIFLDHYNIVGNFTDRCAIYIGLNQFSYSLTFHILNTNAKRLQGIFLEMKAKHSLFPNTIILANCRFNDDYYKTHQHLYVVLFNLFGVSAYFNSCHFVNCNKRILGLESGTVVFSYCTFHHNKIYYGLITIDHYSNLTIEHCKFYKIRANIVIYLDAKQGFQDVNCTQTVTVIIKNTTFVAVDNHLQMSLLKGLISVLCARLLMIGPIKFNNITDLTVIRIVKSTITIYGYIEFTENIVVTLITYSECESVTLLLFMLCNMMVVTFCIHTYCNLHCPAL